MKRFKLNMTGNANNIEMGVTGGLTCMSAAMIQKDGYFFFNPGIRYGASHDTSQHVDIQCNGIKI